MSFIQGTISVNGLPRNGATANLYLASIFPTPPPFNTPLPPNPIATVTTGHAYGGDGAYLFTVGSFGEWWVGVDWNGTILWEYHTFGTTTVTTVNIESYGAHSIDDLGYSTFDSAPAINSAIAALISANGGQGQVIIPRKRYRIDSPILIARITGGNNWNFGSMTLRGDDSCAKDDPGQAAILPSYNSDPAIVVQWGRNVRIKDLIVTGLNDTSALLGGTNYGNLMTDANFVTAGCRDNRYSPYCAIAVDPYKNTVGSSDRYPLSDALGYYDYLPHTNDGTSGLQIENVTARYFVVGFNISNAPNIVQGDVMVLKDCKTYNTKVAVAIGQSQDRGISIEGGAYSWTKYFVSCSQYGQRTGPPPMVFGAIASACKYLLEYDSAQGSACWDGFYCESTYSIGNVGKNAASTSEAFVFNGCQFKFHDGALRPDYHLRNEADVAFNGCYFNTKELPISVWSDQNAPRPIKYSACHFQLNNTKPAVDNYGTWNPFQGQHVFDDCTFQDSGSQGGPTTGFSNVSHSKHTLSPTYAGHDRAIVAPGAQFRYQQGTLFGNPAVNQIHVADGALGIVALTPSSGVAVTPDGLGGATFTGTQNGDLARVGDHVHAFNNVLVPELPDGASAQSSANMLIGRISAISGPATAPVVTLDSCPQCLSGTPTLDCRVVFMKRFHQPTVGDVTSGSATVSNVALVGGGSVSNSWQAGHRIQGLGIALGTYLTAVSGTNLTLSRPATATNSGTPLYDCDTGVIAPNRWAAVGTKTWDPASLTSGSAATTTIAVAGATIGDFVTASFSNSLQGMQLTGYVDSAGSVTVVLFNSTAGTLDLASGTLLVNLARF